MKTSFSFFISPLIKNRFIAMKMLADATIRPMMAIARKMKNNKGMFICAYNVSQRQKKSRDYLKSHLQIGQLVDFLLITELHSEHLTCLDFIPPHIMSGIPITIPIPVKQTNNPTI